MIGGSVFCIPRAREQTEKGIGWLWLTARTGYWVPYSAGKAGLDGLAGTLRPTSPWHLGTSPNLASPRLMHPPPRCPQVGDVAARAGVKLAQADEALKALAYDTAAALQVCVCVWGGGGGGGGVDTSLD